MQRNISGQLYHWIISRHVNFIMKVIQFLHLVALGSATGQPVFYLMAAAKACKALHTSVYRMVSRLIRQRLLAAVCLGYYLTVLLVIASTCNNAGVPWKTIWITLGLVLPAADMILSFSFKLVVCRLTRKMAHDILSAGAQSGIPLIPPRAIAPLLLRVAGVAAGAVRW